MRRILFVVASIIASAFFLWLAMRDVPMDEIIESIRQANILWVIAALVFVTLGLWTRAIRWRVLLENKIDTRQAFYILSIGMLLNQLPFRVGEVARSGLATRSKIPFITAVTSILVERLLDTLLVVIALALALTQIPNAPPELTQPAALFGIVGIIAFGVLLVFARKPDFAWKVLGMVQSALPFIKRLKLDHLLENILQGIRPLAQWGSAFSAILWTLISWGLSMATFYCLGIALNVLDSLPLMTVLSVTMASFSIVIPVTVAAVGPFEAAVRLAGDAVQLPSVSSIALGFLFHGVTILGYAIWGALGMVLMGVSFGEMLSGAKPVVEGEDNRSQ